MLYTGLLCLFVPTGIDQADRTICAIPDIIQENDKPKRENQPQPKQTLRFYRYFTRDLLKKSSARIFFIEKSYLTDASSGPESLAAT